MTPPRPRASHALQTRLAAALALRLRGHSVDRLWRPTEDSLLIRVTQVAPERLLIHLDPALPFVALTAHWPPTPQSPDQTTVRLRQALEGARFVDVTVDEARAVTFHLTRGDGPRTLRVQLAGRYPNATAYDAAPAELARLLLKRPPADPDSPPLPEGPLPGEPTAGDLLLAWATDRADALQQLGTEQRLLPIMRAARGQLRKLERAEAAIAADLARAADAAKHRVYGDLLKTALSRVVPGAERVAIPDHASPGSPLVEVPLDPALNARANLDRHFRLYRRFRDSADATATRLEQARARLREAAALVADLAALAPGASAADLDALEARLVALGWRPQRPPKHSHAKPEPTLPYRRFAALDGSLILVGRSAAQNDHLTFRHGRAGDLWLHARDVPGSHVLLRPPAGREATGDALLDAATLAAWHSQSRADTTVDVTWTERKHVRKARSAPPGRVTLSRGRTLTVRVDKERIDRLYASLGPDEPR